MNQKAAINCCEERFKVYFVGTKIYCKFKVQTLSYTDLLYGCIYSWGHQNVVLILINDQSQSLKPLNFYKKNHNNQQT
jgi:hypothetical protein